MAHPGNLLLPQVQEIMAHLVVRIGHRGFFCGNTLTGLAALAKMQQIPAQIRLFFLNSGQLFFAG